MHYALNVGLDPSVVADPHDPSTVFPTVTGGGQAGLVAAARDLVGIGLTLENCLLTRETDTAEALREMLLRRNYDIVGGGVRL